MKFLLLLFLFVSCSENPNPINIQQGIFLHDIRGSYTLNESAELWFKTHLPQFVFPSNLRIEIRDSGNFAIVDRIEFKFLFLERNTRQWGVYEFVFNTKRYFVGFRREGNTLVMSPDNIVTETGTIGKTEGMTTLFADIIP